MKKRGLLCLILALLIGCLPVVAADAPLTFCDVTQTPDIAASGYPRFARLQNGSLLLANSGVVRISNNGGKSWARYSISASKTAVSPTGTKHTLTLANWQPFVLPDGTVLMAYRAHTANYTAKAGAEFYTSIRVLTGNAAGTSYKNEEVLVEGVCNGHFYGFWEPFMIQIDEDTVALYFADDLSVFDAGCQQQINFITYSISEKKWDKTVRTAVDGESRRSRDGMPAVTQLRDGSFAMVFEAFDCHKNNSIYNAPFVISLARSKDGIHWDDPVAVVGPTDLRSGRQCAAPFIATLPDGRVVITYMTDETYTGLYRGESVVYNSVFGMAISDAPLTYETKLTGTTTGAAKGFTRLENPFGEVQNGYQVWNTVYCSGGELYISGSAGVNGTGGTRSGQKIVLRRADVSALTVTADLDGDGRVALADVLLCLKRVEDAAYEKDYRMDQNGDGAFTVADAVHIMQRIANDLRIMGK